MSDGKAEGRGAGKSIAFVRGGGRDARMGRGLWWAGGMRVEGDKIDVKFAELGLKGLNLQSWD